MDRLQKSFPALKFKIETFSTKGDRILDVSLNKIGDKGLFTKELEVALQEDYADIAVHSLKDMPTELPEKLIIGAITEREDPSDAVVLHKKHQGKTLATLPDGSLIGTSSLRRVAQLKKAFPQYNFESIRGNLQTRLMKLDDYETYHFDAIILASAGLIRMDLSERITEHLPNTICLPAVGQGALAIECRENDEYIIDILKKASHTETTICCTAERAFMKEMQGGCQVPIGVHTTLQKQGDVVTKITLKAILLNLDGTQSLEDEIETNDYSVAGALAIGKSLAQNMKKNGAEDILKKIYSPIPIQE